MEFWQADLSLWRFPASLILGAAFLLLVAAGGLYYSRSRIVRVLSSARTGIGLLLATASITAAEGIWSAELHHSWPFILLILLLTAHLGLILCRRTANFRSGWTDAAFLLNHGGLFLILWGALFGAPDTMEAKLVLHPGEPSRIARTLSGELRPLPFEIRLRDFRIDYYDDGRTPRQFRSDLLIDATAANVEVNRPHRHEGYLLYQDGYDLREGKYSILLLVRDPWIGIVYAGLLMLAAGSVIFLFCNPKNRPA